MSGSNAERIVLLADDEEIVRVMCESAFATQETWLLDAASTVQEALDKVACIAYDALILDMAFPDGRFGMDVLRAVRLHEIETYQWRHRLVSEARIMGDMRFIGAPIVPAAAWVLTGTMSPKEVEVDARALGVANTIVKPILFTVEFVRGLIEKMEAHL